MSPQIALSHSSHNTPLLTLKLHRLQSHSRATINYGLGCIRGHLESAVFHPHEGRSVYPKLPNCTLIQGHGSKVNLCLSGSHSFLSALTDVTEPSRKLRQVYVSALSDWGEGG